MSGQIEQTQEAMQNAGPSSAITDEAAAGNLADAAWPFRCWLLLCCISVEGCISKACLYATWLMGVSAVIKGGQLTACCTACCVVPHASFIGVMLHLACVSGLASPLQPGQNLPALAICIYFGFLYILLCVFMLVCRLNSDLPKVQWSLVVAAFLA